jgi:hypothetical protein
MGYGPAVAAAQTLPIQYSNTVNLCGEPIHAHKEFVLAVDADGILLQQDNEGFLQQVRNYVENDQDLRVYSTCLHPFGIGLLSLETNYHRDLLMAGNLHDIDGINVCFVGHDHGFNRREHGYSRYGWIMFLGYPLDYGSLEFIVRAVSTFGKMISWHNNPRKLGFVLVKCLYNNTASVPRSIEFRGNGYSWTVPVYVLNS